MMSGCGAAGLAMMAHRAKRILAEEPEPKVRVITRGPQHHWFGYYDKFEFDPSDRYVLSMETDFEHRSPRADDEIRIGMVDLHDNDRWIELGKTTAWCWQQGCMLQWIPESNSEVIWNDRQGDHFICHIMDVTTRETRTLQHPVYTVSADGTTGVAPDFSRVQDVRPGYGYPGLVDPHKEDLAPGDTGIFRVDLASGHQDLIISIAEVVEMGTIPRAEPGIKHYFNHLLFNPYGERFIFLHRWRYPNGKRLSRMLTANPDGSDIRIVDGNGLTSHFIWRDKNHILAWSRNESHGAAFYLYEDGGDKIEVVGKHAMPADGHCNYLPGGEWIVNDTYPDKNREQEVYLYHPGKDQRISLGRYLSPPVYTGEWRCDTHPRASRSGNMLVIDSPHLHQGRQLHLIDISAINL
jgi:hypothetical protein